MTFEQMNLSAPICKALLEKNYSTPTSIQKQAIPEALAGRDILGLAQTGTGKTAAFALPVIEQLLAEPRQGKPYPIRALILTPTRELAIQIDDELSDYARHTSIRHTVIFGGVKQLSQTNELRAGIDILTATPGRLLDLMTQGFIHLDQVRHFVLDEADRMLDMGFIHDIKRILPKLPAKKQTLFFSATMPDSIDHLAKSLLRNPVRVEVTPASSVVEVIAQSVYQVEKSQKKQLLVELLKGETGHQVLVFSRTKHGADNIARYVSRRGGIPCESIHGDKSQNSRQRALSNFKEGRSNVIIATDIAARGIDIKALDLVVNYDLPDVPETYVHRIGRTGRAGCDGRAIAFCSPEELALLKDIEKLTGLKLPRLQHSLPAVEPATADESSQRTPQRTSAGQQRPAARSQQPSKGEQPAKRRRNDSGRRPSAESGVAAKGEKNVKAQPTSPRTPSRQEPVKQKERPVGQSAGRDNQREKLRSRFHDFD